MDISAYFKNERNIRSAGVVLILASNVISEKANELIISSYSPRPPKKFTYEEVASGTIAIEDLQMREQMKRNFNFRVIKDSCVYVFIEDVGFGKIVFIKTILNAFFDPAKETIGPLRITIRSKLIFVMLVVIPILTPDQVHIFKFLIPAGLWINQ